MCTSGKCIHCHIFKVVERESSLKLLFKTLFFFQKARGLKSRRRGWIYNTLLHSYDDWSEGLSKLLLPRASTPIKNNISEGRHFLSFFLSFFAILSPPLFWRIFSWYFHLVWTDLLTLNHSIIVSTLNFEINLSSTFKRFDFPCDVTQTVAFQCQSEPELVSFTQNIKKNPCPNR